MENTLIEIGRILTMYLTLPIIAATLLLLLGLRNQDRAKQQGRTYHKEVPPKGKRLAPGNKKGEGSGGSNELQE